MKENIPIGNKNLRADNKESGIPSIQTLLLAENELLAELSNNLQKLDSIISPICRSYPYLEEDVSSTITAGSEVGERIVGNCNQIGSMIRQIKQILETINL